MCHGKAQQALLYIQPIFCLHLAAKLNVLMLPTYIQNLYVWSKIDQFFLCEAIQFIINYTNHSSPSNSIQFEINWMLISHTFYKICLFFSNIFGLFPPPQICLYPSALCANCHGRAQQALLKCGRFVQFVAHFLKNCLFSLMCSLLYNFYSMYNFLWFMILGLKIFHGTTYKFGISPF